jgi:predicted NAD/FAD-dependent oxidoreductase
VQREDDASPRYVGVPRMSVLARDLAGDLAVHCSQHVAAVERDESGWRLVTREDEAHGPFEAVVLAAPAPQTLSLLPRVGAVERFAERITAVEIDPCHAVMAAFAAPLEVGFEAAFVSASPLAWIARNSSKPGRPAGECWVLHASPEWSRGEVDLEPEKVAGRLLEALSEAVARPLPEPLHVGHHRWLYARTRVACGGGPLWAPDEGIGVCGDWMLGSRVEDAFTSGLALASAVLQAEPSNAPTSGRR